MAQLLSGLPLALSVWRFFFLRLAVPLWGQPCLGHEHFADARWPEFGQQRPRLAEVWFFDDGWLSTEDPRPGGLLLRLRRRFGRCLRAEIGETVAVPRDVDDEVRYLLQILRA